MDAKGSPQCNARLEKLKKMFRLFIETCTTVGTTNENKEAYVLEANYCHHLEQLCFHPIKDNFNYVLGSILISHLLSKKKNPHQASPNPKPAILSSFYGWKRYSERARAPYIWDCITVQQALGTQWHHIRIEVVAILQSLLDSIFFLPTYQMKYLAHLCILHTHSSKQIDISRHTVEYII